jgi:hypothetical protein
MGEPDCIHDTFDLQKRGFDALVRELGEIGAIAFLQLYDRGSGDYTKERHNYFKHMSVDDIANGVISRRKF